MKKYIIPLLIVGLLTAGMTWSASVFKMYQGGTGLSTPDTGSILYTDTTTSSYVYQTLVCDNNEIVKWAAGLPSCGADNDTGGGAGGADTQVQYNSSDAFLGSDAFTFDDSSIILNVSTGTGLFNIMGIGDTSPDAALEVTSDGDAYFMISSQDVNDGNILVVDSTGGIGIGIKALDYSSYYGLDVNGTANFQQAVTGISINEIEDPTADKLFTFPQNVELTWRSNDNTPTAGEGVFNWESIGAFSGSLVHIHQHTGNPGASNLLTLESEDADVIPLTVTGTGTIAATFSGGNFGIGDTGPDAACEVVSNGNAYFMLSSEIDTDGDILFVDSGGNMALNERDMPTEHSVNVSILNPDNSSNGFVIIGKARATFTITGWDCIVDPGDAGESVSLDVQECDGTGDNCATIDAALTCDNDGATDDGSLANAQIDEGDWWQVVVGSISGTVSNATATINYYWNPIK